MDDTRPEDARWRDWFVYRGKLGTVFASYDVGMTNYEPFDKAGKHRRWTFLGYPSSIVSGAAAEAEAGLSDWGFAGLSGLRSQTGYAWTVIPLWMIAVPLAVLPAVWVAVRMRSKPAGRCRNCGYDLRATPDRCPECGHVAETPARNVRDRAR